MTTGSKEGELGDQRQTHDSLLAGGDGHGTEGQGQLPLPCVVQGPVEANKCPLSISLNSCTRLLKLAALFRCRHRYGVSPGDGVSRPCLEGPQQVDRAQGFVRFRAIQHTVS